MTDEQIREMWNERLGKGNADIVEFARALLADGGKGEASLTRWQKAQMAFGGTAPQAECAPREAQPEPESACNPADICAGCRCEYSQSADPIAPRADEMEICGSCQGSGFAGADCVHACFTCNGSGGVAPRADADNLSNRMYEAAKKWGVNKSCDQKLDFVDGYETACRDLANHARADAEKDAARYRYARQLHRWPEDYDAYIDRQILAAKEKK
jgi:hypothetical protein